MVYAASDVGGFVALDAATGTLVWHHDTGTDLTGTAVVADGIAYVGSSGDLPGAPLTALDAKTGAVLWTDPEPLFAPAVSAGVAFSGGPSGGRRA